MNRIKTVMLFISPELIGMLFLGSIILCLPYLEKGKDLRRLPDIFGKNALMAGYLEAFMLVFVRISQNNIFTENILSDLVLDFRPAIYGFLCYIIFRDKNKEKTKEEDAESEKEPPILVEKEKRPPDLEILTRRERQIAGLIKKGLSNREIAEELYISETTVKKHVSNIFEKLKISSRKDLM